MTIKTIKKPEPQIDSNGRKKVSNMVLKFKKIPKEQIKITENQICVKNKCGKQPSIPIKKPIIIYEVGYTERHDTNEDEKSELLILGKDKDNSLSAVLYDTDMKGDMKIITENDTKTVEQYSYYSKSVLNSRKKFSQEGDIGKARITYQFLQDMS